MAKRATAETATAKGAEANAKALRNVSARVIQVSKDERGNFSVVKANGLGETEPGKSNRVPNDPAQALSERGEVIEPPFDMLTLAMLKEHSSELGQCLDAMVTNIATTGHRFLPRVNPSNGTGAQKKAAVQERVDLINFFTYATDESYVEFRSKLTHDLEATGNSYYEVVRTPSGSISGFYHLPSYQMRLTKREDESRLVKEKQLRLQADQSVKIVDSPVNRRYRKFVQTRATTMRSYSLMDEGKRVYYREFGDVRRLNKETGEYETTGKKVPKDKLASEVVHSALYSTRSAYGTPRFIGNLLSILGDRGAEEINFITFQNNNIPSMALLVSNGQLTEGTIGRISEFVESQVKGSDNYSKFLILEGETLGEEGEDGGQMKIEIKPLTGDQHKDALFQNYSANNQDKIRRSFRLPELLVGKSSGMNRAVADMARRLADEQVFAPARNEYDSFLNRRIFPEMGIQFYKYQSNTPNTTDNSQLVRILGGSEKTGGMTPRIARDVLEGILGLDLTPFPADFPQDVPFSLTMAEAVKSKADTSEVGQAVTALKALGQLGEDEELKDLDLDDEEATVNGLLALQKAAEGVWKAQASS